MSGKGKTFKFAPFSKGRSVNQNTPTPEALYRQLDAEFHFDFDPCPLPPKGLREFDGLGEWGQSNFVNPPYNDKEKWIRKAIEQAKKGKTVVML
ncbi:MAG: DNA N-6-adenine-methyltransferase, partial [Desulfitobacteriaceae bacterium]|nr:DNA N-6-adenine-methyltransferase [Desulfitobacteriaceae bacterium]